MARRVTRGRKRTQKPSRKARKQKGGAVIGSGSYGIVFRPSPRKDAPPDTVGKLMLKSEAEHELEMIEKITEALGGYDTDYFLLPVPTEHSVSRLNSDIYKLKSSTLAKERAIFEKIKKNSLDYSILEYQYGGETLLQYVSTMLNGVTSYDDIKLRIQALVYQLHRLLLGLSTLGNSENFITHRDIKPINILVETAACGIRSIRFIDFGIAVFNDEIQDHTMSENSCDYPYYPPEAVISFTKVGVKHLYSPVNDLVSYVFRNNAKDYYLENFQDIFTMEERSAAAAAHASATAAAAGASAEGIQEAAKAAGEAAGAAVAGLKMADTFSNRQKVMQRIQQNVKANTLPIIESLQAQIPLLWAEELASNLPKVNLDEFVTKIRNLPVDNPRRIELRRIQASVQYQMLMKFDVFSLGFTLHMMFEYLIDSRLPKAFGVLFGGGGAAAAGAGAAPSSLEDIDPAFHAALKKLMDLFVNMMHWDILSRPTALQAEDAYNKLLREEEQFQLPKEVEAILCETSDEEDEPELSNNSSNDNLDLPPPSAAAGGPAKPAGKAKGKGKPKGL